MSFRQAIVVATHPEDHSVDLVMVDDGSRHIGVQVATSNGSTRSGTMDMPHVPEKPNKWDITQRTGQDQIALVGEVRGHPVVMGFLMPQVNQMTFKDPKLKLTRHQSDVYSTIDGDGNMQIVHPSGAYVRLGETADKEDYTGKDFDQAMAIDRNTGRKPYVRVVVPGAFDLQMTPDGALTLTVEKGGNIEFGEAVTLKAPSVTLDTPQTEITGEVHIVGNVTVDADVVASGISLVHHIHDGVIPGPATTGEPV